VGGGLLKIFWHCSLKIPTWIVVNSKRDKHEEKRRNYEVDK